MARLFLALGLLADGACLALLIGVAGFVFEGPEGARGEASAVAVWTSGIVIIVASVVGALVLARRGRSDRAAWLAWLPPALGLALTFGLGEMILPP